MKKSLLKNKGEYFVPVTTADASIYKNDNFETVKTVQDGLDIALDNIIEVKDREKDPNDNVVRSFPDVDIVKCFIDDDISDCMDDSMIDISNDIIVFSDEIVYVAPKYKSLDKRFVFKLKIGKIALESDPTKIPIFILKSDNSDDLYLVYTESETIDKMIISQDLINIDPSIQKIPLFKFA